MTAKESFFYNPVTKNKKCFIIAEIGVNHNGNIDLAKNLIYLAKKSGADAVKFQTFIAENLVTRQTEKVAYQKKSSSSHESHFDMIKRLELSFDDHYLLMKYCKDIKIEFLSTPYDLESAKFLNEDLKVNFFKTASADIVDLPLQEYIASTKKPSIVSVGMASIDEIEEVVKIYNKKNITLLHCVSNYPCSDESLNLNVIKTLRNIFSVPIGFSDHSTGSEAALAAISLGASIIEKHFTTDKNLDGPDHFASATPQEFLNLSQSVRKVEKMLGNKIKTLQPEEIEMKIVSRKSVTLRNNLKAGDIINSSDLALKRPGTGLMASEIKNLIGKTITRDLEAEYQITYDDIE